MKSDTLGVSKGDTQGVPLSEKRKGQRRQGRGRRTHGDRRVTSPTPAESHSGWKPREKARRAQRRRTLPDRRST